MQKWLWLSVVFFCFITTANAKQVVGWVEMVKIAEEGIELKAKIDTGARHTSLHCNCIIERKENGDKYVLFNIESDKGQIVKVQKKVIRQAKIKRHDGEFQIRDVIKLEICLGNVKKEVEVNLIDRSGLNYSLLVGRSFLQNDFLVDPAEKFLRKPSCH